MYAFVENFFESVKKSGQSGPNKSTGSIEQIIGPVVDVHFSSSCPSMNEIVLLTRLSNDKQSTEGTVGGNGKSKKSAKATTEFVVAEVRQFIGSGSVRTIALESTDGLKRGGLVFNTEMPLKVPVGNSILGRMMNLFGDRIDGKGPVSQTNVRSVLTA